MNAEGDIPMNINIKDKNPIDRSDTTTANSNVKNLETRPVTKRDVLFSFLPIITHIYDLGSDLYLTKEYIDNDKNNYAVLTILFMILPALTLTWISSRMLEQDSQQVNKWLSPLKFTENQVPFEYV